MGNVIKGTFGHKSKPAPIIRAGHFADRFAPVIDRINTSILKAGCEYLFFTTNIVSPLKAEIKLWLLPEFGERCVEAVGISLADGTYYVDWGDEVLKYSRDQIAAEVSNWASAALKRHLAPVKAGHHSKPILSIV